MLSKWMSVQGTESLHRNSPALPLTCVPDISLNVIPLIVTPVCVQCVCAVCHSMCMCVCVRVYCTCCKMYGHAPNPKSTLDSD